MITKVEVLRSLNQWIEVKNLGPEPYELRGVDSHTGVRVKYVIGQDEDGAGAILTTISPAKDALGKKLSKTIGQQVFYIKTKLLEKDSVVLREGILPGNTKSEMLRITQE